jgi:hypothetical protein
MNYFQQDLIYLVLCVLLAAGLPSYLAARRSLAGGWPAVLLVLLLTIAGLADLIFQSNPGTAVVLLADAVNVFCFLFSLTIFAHYSLVYFFPGLRRVSRWLYAPALALALLYFLSPWLVRGIVQNSYLGFRLDYAPGFWLLPVFGVLFGGGVLALNCLIIFSDRAPADKDRSLYLIFVLFLALFFFHACLILPFLAGTVNFASTLTLALAIGVIVYACAYHGFFLAE